jgi:hypothetical protein
MKEQILALGAVPLSSTPAESGKWIVGQTEKSGKVIRTANIKVE